MRIALVDDNNERADTLERALGALGHRLVGRLSTRDDLRAAVLECEPEVMLIGVDAPSRDLLDTLADLQRELPRPIVVFSRQSDAETTRLAIRAGVSAYVVDDLAPARLQPVLDVAIARFHEHQALHRELEDTRQRLAERKDIERAKHLLMQRRALAEPEAYRLLRKMAMDRKLRLGEVARAVLMASELEPR